MPKTYVTFGQNHTHSVAGKTIDKDCVAVIDCKDAVHGRELAFEVFDRKFCMEYHEAEWNPTQMHYYPRGYIYLYAEDIPS